MYLKGKTSILNGVSNLSNGTSNQETSGDNTNNWGKRKDLLHQLREEFVQTHSNGNGCQDNLRKQNKTQYCVSLPCVILKIVFKNRRIFPSRWNPASQKWNKNEIYVFIPQWWIWQFLPHRRGRRLPKATCTKWGS